MVEVRQIAERLDRFENVLLPRMIAIALACRLAKLLLVCFVFAKRMMGELEVRAELSVDEDRRAEAGPESDHQLDTLAPHDGESLHVGVILDADRTPELLLERARQIETVKAICA